jgi:transposase
MLKEQDLKNLSEDFRKLFADMNNIIVELRQENSKLQRELYGKKAETHIVGNLIIPKNSLFNEAECLAANALLEEEAEEDKGSDSDHKDSKKKKKRSENSGGRDAFSEQIPRRKVIHEVPEEKLICPTDGETLVQIGERIVETLEIIPAKITVIQNVYRSFGCPKCHNTVVQAPVPPTAFPKHSCDASLVAYLITQKYLWGLPLYRQEDMLRMAGADISRTSIARWIITASKFLEGIASEIKNYILSRNTIHADETFVQVLKEPGKTAESKSYMWCLCTSKHDPTAVWFEYSPHRNKAAAENLLQNFKGILHLDGYESYSETVFKNGITRIGCVAHARRKFDVAKKDGSNSSKKHSVWFLNAFQKLFLLERDWENLNFAERVLKRNQEAALIWNEIQNKLTVLRPQVTPKSNLGKALNYLSNQWNDVTKYLSYGDTEISNNRMENFIRPFAIGRKNWLFSNSQAGAKASSNLYSILMTAKYNNLDVTKYLTTLFTELPKIYELEESPNLEKYLPWNWKE